MNDSVELQLEKIADDSANINEELEESFYEERLREEQSHSYSLSTWLTGLTTGKVIGQNVTLDDDIEFTVRLDSGATTEVTVENTGGYHDSNPLIRLLETHSDQLEESPKVEYMLGETIPLYIDRWALPSNHLDVPEVRPYMPQSLDTIGGFWQLVDKGLRFTGREGVNDRQHPVSIFLLWMSILTVTLTGFMFTQVGGGVLTALGTVGGVMPQLLLSTAVLAGVLTLVTPILFRLSQIPFAKYRKIQTENSAVND